MAASAACQKIQSKFNEFHRVTTDDSDETLKNAMQEILRLWPEILALENEASDDDLFCFNVDRAAITKVFAIILSKEFLQKDYPFLYEIFFSCFHTLGQFFPKERTPFLESNIRLIIQMLTTITSSVLFKIDDLTDEKDLQLLIALREYIDQDFTQDPLTEGIISFIWNLSDRTMLVPILIRANYASSVVNWLKERDKKFRDDKIDAPLHILHNLARHDDGIDQLNHYQALDVIERISSNFTEEKNSNDLTIHIAMIRALLTDVSTIRNERKKYSEKIIDMLMQITMNAVTGERYRHDGSHVSEPLTALVKLCYNDQILHYLVTRVQTDPPSTTKSVIDFFASILTQFYPNLSSDEHLLENYTCVTIFNLLWLISNHQEYRSLLLQHQELMKLIEKAANENPTFIDRFMPRTLKSIEQAAKDIHQNLH